MSQQGQQDRSAELVTQLERLLPTHTSRRQGGAFFLEELVILASEESKLPSKFTSDLTWNEPSLDPNSAVWVLYVDLFCLSEDGPLLDPIVMLVNALFTDFTLPQVIYNPTEGSVTQTSTEGGLKVTFDKIQVISILALSGEQKEAIYLVDPTTAEMKYLPGSLVTLAYRQQDSSLVAAFQRTGGKALPLSSYMSLVQLGKRHLTRNT